MVTGIGHLIFWPEFLSLFSWGLPASLGRSLIRSELVRGWAWPIGLVAWMARGAARLHFGSVDVVLRPLPPGPHGLGLESPPWWT